MASNIGRSQVIGIGREATRGTGVTADYWMRKISFDEGRNAEHMPDESALGVSAETSGVDVTRRWAQPSLEAYLDLNSFGLLLYSNAETYSASEVETGVYDHTFKVGTSTYVNNSLTVNADDAVEGDNDYINALINALTLDITMNERVMLTADFVAEFPASGTNTAAIATPQYFYGRQTSVEIGATVAALSSFSGVQSASMTLNNNINADETAFNLGNIDIADHCYQSRNAELTISKFLTDSTYLDYDKLATIRALRFTTTDSATTIGASSNPTVTMTFPYVSVKSVPGGDNNVRRTEELTIMPHYGEDDDESANYLYKIVVRNTVADYSAV